MTGNDFVRILVILKNISSMFLPVLAETENNCNPFYLQKYYCYFDMFDLWRSSHLLATQNIRSGSQFYKASFIQPF